MKDFREIGCEDMDWIHLATGREQRRAVANMVNDLWIKLSLGSFFNG
jgi:hypothetical protein